MPRGIKLTPEERERKRKERIAHSFSDAAYNHYNPETEGFGSPGEWARTIEDMAAGCGYIVHRSAKVPKDLIILGLEEMPDHVDGLKKAFRKQTFICHPDHGGTSEKFIELTNAFERLCKFYRK